MLRSFPAGRNLLTCACIIDKINPEAMPWVIRIADVLLRVCVCFVAILRRRTLRYNKRTYRRLIYR